MYILMRRNKTTGGLRVGWRTTGIDCPQDPVEQPTFLTDLNTNDTNNNEYFIIQVPD